MDQKDFESRLDGYADRMSRVVSDGVKKVEEAFDRGKTNLRTDIDSDPEERSFRGSPRMGALLVAAGILWLLFTLGVLASPVFPIIVIVVGVYFLLRNR